MSLFQYRKTAIQVSTKATFSSGGSNEEESAFKLTHAIGKINCIVCCRIHDSLCLQVNNGKSDSKMSQLARQSLISCNIITVISCYIFYSLLVKSKSPVSPTLKGKGLYNIVNMGRWRSGGTPR